MFLSMKNFLKAGFLLAIVISLFLGSCNKSDDEWSKTKLRFISEEYKPFNYTENSNAYGLAPDLLKSVCSKLNMDYTIEFLPWDEGYSEALSSDNGVLFTTALNSVRKDLFKWAGPIASLDWDFYAAAPGSFTISSLDDAKKVEKIGVIVGYASEEYLVQEGFTNLVYCTNVNDCVSKLLKGEIDLYPSDRFTMAAALESQGKTIYAVKSLLNIKTDLLYFAFNKNVSDDLIADFQAAIDQTKEEGTLKKLTEQYLKTSDYPDALQVYTEQYPPLTFRNEQGEITGFGTDIVREIMERNNTYSGIQLSSWSNGYQLALINPNFCLFTMDWTTIRENLFQWVGPIGTNKTWFYTKSGSGITIASLDDAKKLTSIGAVNSWFSTQYLIQQGFDNLVNDNQPVALAEKLMKGEIDAFVCSDVTFPDILRDAGYNYSGVTPSFSFMSSDYYIAFSNSTPTELVNKWQLSLEAMKNDGIYNSIHQKWFP
jgi:ABC-type amino acid transport substrate-binding protein